LLVIRKSLPLSTKGRNFLTAAEPYLVNVQPSSEWPGTQTSDVADVYRYRLEDGFSAMLTESVEGLFEWRQPDRPEDLCLMRPSGQPWLVTVAHEREAWLGLTHNEKDGVIAPIRDLLTPAS